ncbi:hypothetical protein [Shouchella patagoniensis]|uniref:hypothetical protein n=1 Tax=Shouchella patagoniensis TaxID=228576 RepID=UPI00099567C1|nr:hypothetical protein [Shouchella patagoniensis]
MFIDQLYTEETVDEEVDFYDKEWTKDEFEALMSQQNTEELMQAILFFAQSDVDVKWFGEKLLQLSYDSQAIVRREVAECIWSNMTHQFTEEQNQAFIETFKKDQDPDVRMYVELFEEKLTYSYEMLQEEIKQNIGGVYLTFYLDGYIIIFIMKRNGVLN